MEAVVGMGKPSKANALDVLAKFGWFATRTADVRATIGPMLMLRGYVAGEAIYHVGDEPNGLFGLVSGAFDISIPRGDGRSITMHRSEAGFWVGDLALLAHNKRLVSVYAAEDSIVVHLPVPAMRALVDKDPRYYEEFYALTYDNMATALQLLAALTAPTSRVRVALRLIQQIENQGDPGAWITLSQGALSEMVGLSRTTLHRVLSGFAAARLVEIGYGRLRIRDIEGLRRLCDDDTVRLVN